MKKVFSVSVSLLIGMFFFNKPVFAMSCHGGDDMDHQSKGKETKKTDIESVSETVYFCPMHTDVRGDKPGKCPECGMDLETKQVTSYRIKKDNGVELKQSMNKAGAQKSVVYTCPMHPEVRSDKRGKCPKCGMKLKKR